MKMQLAKPVLGLIAAAMCSLILVCQAVSFREYRTFVAVGPFSVAANSAILRFQYKADYVSGFPPTADTQHEFAGFGYQYRHYLTSMGTSGPTGYVYSGYVVSIVYCPLWFGALVSGGLTYIFFYSFFRQRQKKRIAGFEVTPK